MGINISFSLLCKKMIVQVEGNDVVRKEIIRENELPVGPLQDKLVIIKSCKRVSIPVEINLYLDGRLWHNTSNNSSLQKVISMFSSFV